MQLYQVLAIFSILSILLFSCTSYEESFRIEDVSSERTQEHIVNCQPTGITVKIKGELDGSATIALYSKIDSGQKYKYNLAGGLIDTSMHGDWYSKDLFFHYLPVTASTGNLVVKVDLCGPLD